MNFVLVSFEFSPGGDELMRREQLASVLPKMGTTCHVLSATWIILTPISYTEVFGQLVRALNDFGDSPLQKSEKLVVVPVLVPNGLDDPWHAINAPLATKCFNMP